MNSRGVMKVSRHNCHCRTLGVPPAVYRLFQESSILFSGVMVKRTLSLTLIILAVMVAPTAYADCWIEFPSAAPDYVCLFCDGSPAPLACWDAATYAMPGSASSAPSSEHDGNDWYEHDWRDGNYGDPHGPGIGPSCKECHLPNESTMLDSHVPTVLHADGFARIFESEKYGICTYCHMLEPE